MSECKWCDSCDTPYSELDLDARAIQIHEPDVDRNGVKRGVITVERHRCGRCMREEKARREQRAAITAEEDEGAAGHA